MTPAVAELRALERGPMLFNPAPHRWREAAEVTRDCRSMDEMLERLVARDLLPPDWPDRPDRRRWHADGEPGTGRVVSCEVVRVNRPAEEHLLQMFLPGSGGAVAAPSPVTVELRVRVTADTTERLIEATAPWLRPADYGLRASPLDVSDGHYYAPTVEGLATVDADTARWLHTRPVFRMQRGRPVPVRPEWNGPRPATEDELLAHAGRTASTLAAEELIREVRSGLGLPTDFVWWQACILPIPPDEATPCNLLQWLASHRQPLAQQALRQYEALMGSRGLKPPAPTILANALLGWMNGLQYELLAAHSRWCKENVHGGQPPMDASFAWEWLWPSADAAQRGGLDRSVRALAALLKLGYAMLGDDHRATIATPFAATLARQETP